MNSAKCTYADQLLRNLQAAYMIDPPVLSDEVWSVCQKSLAKLRSKPWPKIAEPRPVRGMLQGEAPTIAIGLLPTFSFEAVVQGDPNANVFAIGCSAGLFGLLSLANQYRFAMGAADVPISFSQGKDATFLLCHLLWKYATDPSHDFLVDLMKGRSLVFPAPLKRRLWDSIELQIDFILAHELSHIARGHFPAPTSLVTLSIDARPVDVLSFTGNSYSEEVEADRWALIITRDVFADDVSDSTLVPREASFIFALCEVIRRVSGLPFYSGQSHPTPIDRIRNIAQDARFIHPEEPEAVLRWIHWIEVVAAQIADHRADHALCSVF